jgi:hypothetical protein
VVTAYYRDVQLSFFAHLGDIVVVHKACIAEALETHATVFSFRYVKEVVVAPVLVSYYCIISPFNDISLEGDFFFSDIM